MIAEIIAIGSEMLTPYRQDTNSLFLTERLNEIGIRVAFKTVVGDFLDDLISAARTAIARSELIIFMGGLGPTKDDLTREAVAAALGTELKRDHVLVAEMYKRFADRRITMPENNAQQADMLTDAVVLPNSKGTAPGQWLDTEFEGRERLIALLPGPPHELREMWEQQCMPRLRDKVPAATMASRILKVAMMGESAVDQRAAPIYTKYPNVETTVLAGQGQVEFHLRATGATLSEAQAAVDHLAGELEDEFEDAVFSAQGESLEEIVNYYLQMRNVKLAVAESCTGGMIAERITSVAGSSRSFLGGAVVYSNDLKTLFADVPPLMIEAHGAVSKEVALALAENIREICEADIGVGVTGIAGPGGGTDDKPVGLVFIAVSNGHKQDVMQRRFFGDRERVRRWASQMALDMVRRMLM